MFHWPTYLPVALDPAAPGTAGDPGAGGSSKVPALEAVPAGALALVVVHVVLVVTTVLGVAQVPVATVVVFVLAADDDTVGAVLRRVAVALVEVVASIITLVVALQTPPVRGVTCRTSGKHRSGEREECRVDTHGGRPARAVQTGGSVCLSTLFLRCSGGEQQRGNAWGQQAVRVRLIVVVVWMIVVAMDAQSARAVEHACFD